MSSERPPTRGERAATRRTARLAGRAVGVVKPVLIDKVERDHQQTDAQFLRRRVVVAVTIVVAVAFLGERLKPIQWVGLAGVLVGMIAIGLP